MMSKDIYIPHIREKPLKDYQVVLFHTNVYCKRGCFGLAAGITPICRCGDNYAKEPPVLCKLLECGDYIPMLRPHKNVKKLFKKKKKDKYCCNSCGISFNTPRVIIREADGKEYDVDVCPNCETLQYERCN